MLISECIRNIKSDDSKLAFQDANRQMSYSEFAHEAFGVGTAIINSNIQKQPVCVYMDKTVECIASFAGVLLSGNFYSPIDTKMPMNRVEKIVTTLNPALYVTDEKYYETVKVLADTKPILIYHQVKEYMNRTAIKKASDSILDTDLAYVLFTSGSTGIPKGVSISHRSLMDFIEWGRTQFDIDESTIFGNQTPFYFSMSVFDIYETIVNRATMHIIPKSFFTFTGALMEYMYKHRINTIFWVPSVLAIVARYEALASPHLDHLKNVFFGGEVMPLKQLNKWIAEYPEVRFVNFYGPTEVTDTCSFYEVNRKFEDNEMLPMGFACKNKEILLLDEENHLVTGNEIGEVCVRGTGLANGYYNDLEKTKEVFVQNPLNSSYPETIYRTGDLAYKNEFGEYVYVSRKDYQIKHMGQRIELGEIEVAISAISGVEMCCCIYDSKNKAIVLFYTGDTDDNTLVEHIKQELPDYMMPKRRYKLEDMPLNLNGKIDRQVLKNKVQGD